MTSIGRRSFDQPSAIISRLAEPAKAQLPTPRITHARCPILGNKLLLLLKKPKRPRPFCPSVADLGRSVLSSHSQSEPPAWNDSKRDARGSLINKFNTLDSGTDLRFITATREKQKVFFSYRQSTGDRVNSFRGRPVDHAPAHSFYDR